MTPADIHAWVRTRWVELLDTARAGGARGMNWTRTRGGGTAVEHDGRTTGPIVYDEGYPTEFEADHIATFVPVNDQREYVGQFLTRAWAVWRDLQGGRSSAPMTWVVSREALAAFRAEAINAIEVTEDGVTMFGIRVAAQPMLGPQALVLQIEA